MALFKRASAPEFLTPVRPCGNELELVDWAGSVAVHLRDDTYLGIRTTSAELLPVLREMFADRVADVPVSTAYYSLKLGVPGRRTRTPMHHLQAGAKMVVGTRDLHRALVALAHGVAGHDLVADDDHGGFHRLDAVPVRTPRGVALLPEAVRGMAAAVDKTLLPAGYVFADVPWAQLDAGGRLTVPEVPASVPSRERLEGIGTSLPESVLEPGTYDVAEVLVRDHAADGAPERPAVATYRLAGLLQRPLPDGPGAALRLMTDVARTTTVRGVGWSTPEDLVAAVRDHLG